MTGYLSALVRPRFYWLAVLYWVVVHAAALLAAVAAGGELFESWIAMSILGSGLAVATAACLLAALRFELRRRIARLERAAERLRHRLPRAALLLGLGWVAVTSLQVMVALWAPDRAPAVAAPAWVLVGLPAALGLGVLAGALLGFAQHGWRTDGGEPATAAVTLRDRLSELWRGARRRLAADAPDFCLVSRGASGDLHLRASRSPIESSSMLGYVGWMLIVGMPEYVGEPGEGHPVPLVAFLIGLLVIVIVPGLLTFEFVRWLRGIRRPDVLVIEGDRIRCDQRRSGVAPEIEVGALTGVVWGTREEAVFSTRSGNRYYLGLLALGDEERDVVHGWLAERLPFYRVPGIAARASAQAAGRGG